MPSMLPYHLRIPDRILYPIIATLPHSGTCIPDDIAPRFKERPGGYIRIIKIGIRHGDAAAMSVLQLTTLAADLETAKGGDKKKKAAGTGRRARAKAAADAGKADTTLPAKPSRKRAAG